MLVARPQLQVNISTRTHMPYRDSLTQLNNDVYDAQTFDVVTFNVFFSSSSCWFILQFIFSCISVSRTCHNSTASPWTECTESCGIGLSTRATHASVGCQPPSSLRLCQNRQCAIRQTSTTAGGSSGSGFVASRFNLNALQQQQQQQPLQQQDDAHKVRVSWSFNIYCAVCV